MHFIDHVDMSNTVFPAMSTLLISNLPEMSNLFLPLRVIFHRTTDNIKPLVGHQMKINIHQVNKMNIISFFK